MLRKKGWRRPDGGRGGLAQTNTPGLSDYGSRKTVKMYEIKIRETRKFMTAVSPRRELLWKAKCQQRL